MQEPTLNPSNPSSRNPRKKNGRGWSYLVILALVLLVVVIIARSCRDEYGGEVVPMPDPLSDTTNVMPPADEYDAAPDTPASDTADTVTSPEVMVPAIGTGGSPAVTL
jgi:hypothetical protein